jgi:hypothetical protein
MSRRRKQQPRARPRGAPSPEVKPATTAGAATKPTGAAGLAAKPAAASVTQRQQQHRPQSARRRPQPARRRWWPVPGIPIIVALIAGVVAAVVVAVQSQPASNPAPTGAVLAPISTSVTGQTIDGIQCQAGEQLVYHIHAHLAIYVNGTARVIPEGVGIMPPRTEQSSSEGPFVTGGSCDYWLHAHTADGIIHVESPTQHIYTLGNWFDIWGIPLDSSHVGPATGTVIAYVNGQRYSGDLRAIPLNAHDLIQLDVNKDVAPTPFTFPAGL